jgi:hypothetical protein
MNTQAKVARKPLVVWSKVTMVFDVSGQREFPGSGRRGAKTLAPGARFGQRAPPHRAATVREWSPAGGPAIFREHLVVTYDQTTREVPVTVDHKSEPLQISGSVNYVVRKARRRRATRTRGRVFPRHQEH